MSEQEFEALTNEGDVISVSDPNIRTYLNLNHPIFKLSEIVRKMSCKLVGMKEGEWGKNFLSKQWFTEGVTCQALQVGEGIWRTGKVRIKFVVEFSPDEPSPGNSKSTNSPLDDLRQ